MHESRLALAERYSLSACDAMMAASAMEAGSDILWPEDRDDGPATRGRLRVVNPFGS